jgi:hypothetical protein
MAPFMVGAALLMKSQNLLWASLGRVNLMFIPILLAPNNPQTEPWFNMTWRPGEIERQ